MHMNSLLPLAIGLIGDVFARYEVVPFGLVEDDFVTDAMTQSNQLQCFLALDMERIH